MCRGSAYKADYENLVTRGELRTWICMCLEGNTPTHFVKTLCEFPPCSMLSIIECAKIMIWENYQDIMYLLSSCAHCPNSAHSLTLILSHNILIYLFQLLHADTIVWCLIGKLKSCIILKVVSVSAADLWRWVPWWLHMLLMKNMTLEMQQQFMAHSSEVVKSPFNTRCDMMQALYVRCVNTSALRWEMWIWLADTNFYTSRTIHLSVNIVYFWCNFSNILPLVPLLVE